MNATVSACEWGVRAFAACLAVEWTRSSASRVMMWSSYLVFVIAFVSASESRAVHEMSGMQRLALANDARPLALQEEP